MSERVRRMVDAARSAMKKEVSCLEFQNESETRFEPDQNIELDNDEVSNVTSNDFVEAEMRMAEKNDNPTSEDKNSEDLGLTENDGVAEVDKACLQEKTEHVSLDQGIERTFNDYEVQVEKEHYKEKSDCANLDNFNENIIKEGLDAATEEFTVEVDKEHPTKLHIKRKCCTDVTNNYRISPVHSNESDVDHTDSDPTYCSQDNCKSRYTFLKDIPSTSCARSESSSSSSSSSEDSSESSSDEENVQKGRKRSRNPEKWKQNKAKILRNCGKAYKSVSKSRNQISGRIMKATCPENCRLKCGDNIDTDDRLSIFNNFWKLGDIDKQRAFVYSCMKNIVPRYKYTNAARPRNANQAFYFTVNGLAVRVCKTFYKNTLDISDKMIRTVRLKMAENGFLQVDKRGRHNNHPQIDPDLKEDIKNHINSIPRIESHYVRSTTQREYIDGSKTITQLYKDFEEDQKSKNKNAGKYWIYYNIFTRDFNIGFHQPKKDQCDQCLSYLNADGNAKEKLEGEYRNHLIQKDLCRTEKKKDRFEISKNRKVVVYDLQAVLQCPRGETSAFYYKSKLNSYNLTLVELEKITEDSAEKHHAYKNVHCFYWNETEGKRGAIEIGTCILKYFDALFSNNTDLSETGLDIIFYSDNCCGQNKNKFITSLYLYAINRYNIRSLTHKFLIKGHSQNEGDNVHSLIEKEVKKNLKSGPIYTPHQYVTIIKNARKSKPPFTVHELAHESFVDIKKLQEHIGHNFKTDIQGNLVSWNEIKSLKFVNDKPYSFFYKISYTHTSDYVEVVVITQRRKMIGIEQLKLESAYPTKIELGENKKKDLRVLISKNLIPRFYADFFNSIL